MASKFILISKAYDCLTDEKVKANCEKFGNPDGEEAFKVGIALPSFLIKKDYQIYVMTMTLVLFVLVVPRLFLGWNTKLQSKDVRGVYIDNYEHLFSVMRCPLTYESVEVGLVKMC